MPEDRFFLWMLGAIVAGFLVVMAYGIYDTVTKEPAPCFTHVPDPAMVAARQCEMGAIVKPVNGVALCVCPEVQP